MDFLRSIVNRYHWLLICLFQFAIIACASPDSAPTGETAMLSGEMATLSWNPSAGPDVGGYKVYLATASGEYGAPIATVSMDVTNYTVTGLETGTT